jgi:trimethylamine--corrinoid protein Co-methyltransferase
MKLIYNIGSGLEPEIEKIHECSLRVLDEIGALFHCDEAVEVFKKHGARTDGQVVYISQSLVEGALKTVPKSFQWEGRLGAVITIGDGQTHNLPAYGPIYVLREGVYEKAGHAHFVNFHKLHETSKVVEASNPNVIDVSYVPSEIREFYRLGVPLKYCVKPLIGLVEGREAAEMGLENMYRFYGFRDRVIALGLIDTMGPMRLSTAMSEALMVYSRHGQALIIGPGQTLGLTTPQSLAAVYTMGNAMILAAITLTQLINPGTPIIYSGKSDAGDMRMTSAAAYGGIEALLTSATAARMGKYYGIPTHCGNSNSDSKILDFQCGAEAFMNTASAYLNGVDCLFQACGTLDSYNSISYEKLILDEERIEAFRRLRRGYEVTDETLMFETMKKIGPAGQMFERTNPCYRRDFFSPKFAIRDGHNAWSEKGRPTVESLATAAWKKRLEEYREPELDAEQQKILDKLIPEEYR